MRALLLLTFVSFACGARPPVHPVDTSSALAALGPRIDATAALTGDDLHLDGPPMVFTGAGANAAVILAEDLKAHPGPAPARYALVLRTRQAIPPNVSEDDVDPGLYQGDLLAFDLQTGAACGGVRVVVDSTTWDAVRTPDLSDSPTRAHFLELLKANHAERIRKAVRVALGAPDAPVP